MSAALIVEGKLMATTHAHNGALIAQLEAKEKEVAKLGLALALVPVYAVEIAESSGHVVVMPFDEWMARRQQGAVMMAAAEEYLSRPEVAAWLERTATENEAAVKRFMLEDLHG